MCFISPSFTPRLGAQAEAPTQSSVVFAYSLVNSILRPPCLQPTQNEGFLSLAGNTTIPIFIFFWYIPKWIFLRSEIHPSPHSISQLRHFILVLTS